MTYGAAARFLMCRPDHFGVVYAINPWMDPDDWRRQAGKHRAQAEHEWAALRQALLDLGAKVEQMPAVPGVPDLVFTANAAVVLDRKALLARFRYSQRQAEASHFATTFRWLKTRGIIDAVETLPDGVILEGAGDCVFDRSRNLFWMGYGPRSTVAARDAVEDAFGIEAVALELIDPRFYHVDTALCALPGGEVMYVPDAFSAGDLATIRERVVPEARIEIAQDDAARLAANAVCIGHTLVMSACSARLRAVLAERGYRAVTIPLRSFLRSGGAAFCLTLRLDLMSAGYARPDASSPDLIGVSAYSR